MEYRLSIDVAWRRIRAKRHQPPGNASKDTRRLTFAAAMKQSEQFFRLSDQAGYETKPILLYYGLNQAARAIVAVGAQPNEPWQLNGHGLRCPGLNEATVLGDVVVQDSGTGKSFHRLAAHMSSPTLPTRVEFRELWGSIPEGAEVPLQGSDSLFTAVRMKVSREERSRHGVLGSPGTSGVRLHRVPAHGYSRVGSDELTKLLHKHYPPLRKLAPVAWVIRRRQVGGGEFRRESGLGSRNQDGAPRPGDPQLAVHQLDEIL